MFKKLAVAGASVALLAAAAVPAFAYCSSDGALNLCNFAGVHNTVNTNSNTGNNFIKSWEDEVNGGYINSGNALSESHLGNVVNSNGVSDVTLGYSDWSGLNVNNHAWVYNTVNTNANTGGNYIKASDEVNGGSIFSGNAAAGSFVSNVVNTNVVSGVSFGSFDY